MSGEDVATNDAAGTIDWGSLPVESFDVAFDEAERRCRAADDADRLFDLRMLRAKLAAGLPGDRPATLSDVPSDRRGELEAVYRESAREAGMMLLARDDLPAAWPYFQAIGETGPVRDALDARPTVDGYDERQQELTQIALFEMAHPRRGVEMLLAGSGICNTVTAIDQVMPQLGPADRADCGAVVIDELHGQLLAAVNRELQTRDPLHRASTTLAESIDADPTLLDNGAYHADVSHLASAVRFARSLDRDSSALAKAIDLCRYGERLDETLVFAGEPPFEDLYVASRHFLTALADGTSESGELGRQYFRDRLASEPADGHRTLVALVLTDLLMRTSRVDEAVQIARAELADQGEQFNFSFAEVCREAGRLDVLEEWGRERSDPIAMLAGRFGQMGRVDD